MVSIRSILTTVACIFMGYTTVSASVGEALRPLAIGNNSLVKILNFKPDTAEELMDTGFFPAFDPIQWQIASKNEPTQDDTIAQYKALWEFVEIMQNYMLTTSNLPEFFNFFNKNFDGYSINDLLNKNFKLSKELLKPDFPSFETKLTENGMTCGEHEAAYTEFLLKFIPTKYAQAHGISQVDQSQLMGSDSLDEIVKLTIRASGLNILYHFMVENMISDEIVKSTHDLVDCAQKIISTLEQAEGLQSTEKSAMNVLAEKKHYENTMNKIKENLLERSIGLRNTQTSLREKMLKYASILKAPDADMVERNQNIYKLFPVGTNTEIGDAGVMSYLSAFSTNSLWNQVSTHNRVTDAHTLINPKITVEHVKQAYRSFVNNLVTEQDYGDQTHQIVLRRPYTELQD